MWCSLLLLWYLTELRIGVDRQLTGVLQYPNNAMTFQGRMPRASLEVTWAKWGQRPPKWVDAWTKSLCSHPYSMTILWIPSLWISPQSNTEQDECRHIDVLQELMGALCVSSCLNREPDLVTSSVATVLRATGTLSSFHSIVILLTLISSLHFTNAIDSS